MASTIKGALQKFTVHVYRTGLPPSGHDVELIHTVPVTARNIRMAGRLVLAALAFPKDVMLHVATVETEA